MIITYDKIAKAAYIKLKNTKITKTVVMENGIMFDLDENKKVVGVEILDYSAPTESAKMPAKLLKSLKGLKYVEV